jgi:hypothetical protein
VVAIDRVTFPLFVPGVKLVGLKEQVLCEGRPEQVKEIALENDPPSGAMANVYAADVPAFTVLLEVVGVMLKSPTFSDTVCVFAAGAPLEVADTITLYCPGGVFVLLLTVTVTATGVAEVGLTFADGAKLQVTPVAGALQDNATVPLKGPEALTCREAGELPPGTTATVPGDAAPNAKSITPRETFWVLAAGAPEEFAETVNAY